MDGKNVYQMCLEMGRKLAKETPVEIDLVLPVPDSGVAEEELISAKYTPKQIASNMGADSMVFLSIEGLKESLGNDREYLLVSFDGKYFTGGNADRPWLWGLLNHLSLNAVLWYIPISRF